MRLTTRITGATRLPLMVVILAKYDVEPDEEDLQHGVDVVVEVREMAKAH